MRTLRHEAEDRGPRRLFSLVARMCCCFRARPATGTGRHSRHNHSQAKIEDGGRWDGGWGGPGPGDSYTHRPRGGVPKEDGARGRTGHVRRAWTSSIYRTSARGGETSAGEARLDRHQGHGGGKSGHLPRTAAHRGGLPDEVTVVGGRAERETGSRGSRPGGGPCRDRRERGPPSVDPGAEAGGRAVQSGSHERPERRPLRSAAPM